MLAHGRLALLLVPLGAVAHFTGEVSSRRLQSWQEKVEHIWSSCDNWDRTWSTCDGTNLKCSDHESPGPVDADVEIRLGGLPPSTSEDDVYLQWWAPRRSPTEYQLLESPLNASIYEDIHDAYPKYYDSAFNGGNVRITESGEAVMKVHAPAMYFVWRCLALPHIHMRTCRGDAFTLRFLDGIFFGLNESWVLTGSTESDVHIVSSTALSPTRAPPSGSSGPAPIAIVTGVWRIDRGSTTLTEATTSLTTTSTTITTTSLASLTDVWISAAKDQLQLDALEFSPVYSCFLDNQFFDHFSAECAETCPADAAMAHGQCVREELDIPEVTFDATWKLEVRCGLRCWHDKMNETFHGIRLSMAGHFDIPFQEVTHVSLGFESVEDGRRLEEGTIQPAYMRVRVETSRHSEDSGETLMDNFLPDTAIAAQLLGVQVHSVQLVDDPVDINNGTSMEWDTDPYTPAYEAIEKSPAGSSLGGHPSDFLPPEAIIGIAGGIVAVAAVIGAIAIWRRRVAKQKAEQAREAAKVKEVDSEVAEKGKEADFIGI